MDAPKMMKASWVGSILRQTKGRSDHHSSEIDTDRAFVLPSQAFVQVKNVLQESQRQIDPSVERPAEDAHARPGQNQRYL
jgi:hypothetical protein